MNEENDEQKKPKSFEEAFKAATLSAADRKALEEDDPGGDPPPPLSPAEAPPGTPAWALIPSDLPMPRGKEVFFVQFRAAWTDFPDKGDRQCILWSLSDNDEKNALKRARGDRERGLAELAKATLRAIDGRRVDWTEKDPAASPSRFWNEIGAKCRQMVINCYVKTHALSETEQADFFTNCFAVRRTVG